MSLLFTACMYLHCINQSILRCIVEPYTIEYDMNSSCANTIKHDCEASAWASLAWTLEHHLVLLLLCLHYLPLQLHLHPFSTSPGEDTSF
jgi:hypothetical protein